MWRLVNRRVSARRNPARDQTRIWRLSRAILASLKYNRRGKLGTAGEEVETLLGADPPMPQEAWQRFNGWYKAVGDRAPPLARATLKRITMERVDTRLTLRSEERRVSRV